MIVRAPAWVNVRSHDPAPSAAGALQVSVALADRVTSPVIGTLPGDVRFQCTVTAAPRVDGSGVSWVILRVVFALLTV